MFSGKRSVVDGYRVHSQESCIAPCPFHNPSDHPLNNAPMHIRGDKYYLVERICQHGVGHDDPDSARFLRSKGHLWAGIHGCDGCCTKQTGITYETLPPEKENPDAPDDDPQIGDTVTLNGKEFKVTSIETTYTFVAQDEEDRPSAGE